MLSASFYDRCVALKLRNCVIFTKLVNVWNVFPAPAILEDADTDSDDVRLVSATPPTKPKSQPKPPAKRSKGILLDSDDDDDDFLPGKRLFKRRWLVLLNYQYDS